MQRRVSIRLRGNILNYTVKIRGSNTCLVESINTNKACISFLTEDRFLQLIVSPIGNEYYTTFYYNLDVCNCCCYDLSFNFIAREDSISCIDVFYLTDSIYGLKINGTLNFNEI